MGLRSVRQRPRLSLKLTIGLGLAVLFSSLAAAPTLAESGQRIDVKLTASGPWIAHLVGFDLSKVAAVTYWVMDAHGRWRSVAPVTTTPFESPINWWEGSNDGYEVVTAHVALVSDQNLLDPGGWHWVDGHHTDPGGSIQIWTNQDGNPGALYTPRAHLDDMKGVEFWFRDANDQWHNAGSAARGAEDTDWLLQSFKNVPANWQGGENAVSVHVIWPGGQQLVDPTNWAMDFSAQQSDAANPQALTGTTTCGDPHAHVYSPDRLQLLSPCVTVTGVVDAVRKEHDGDLHVLLHLDAGQEKYVNAKNSLESGDLVLEPVCMAAPTQADALGACAGYKNPLSIPPVGAHIAVTGAWVLDLDHGWLEIHPVAAFGPPPTAASPSPTAVQAPPSAAPPPPPPAPAPAPPPPPPPQNLCGAPANPWGYNFCGGSFIYSPPSNFCSYFSCIPSFWRSTNGYVDECRDGTYSHSGGRSGACSYHGGELRPLFG